MNQVGGAASYRMASCVYSLTTRGPLAADQPGARREQLLSQTGRPVVSLPALGSRATTSRPDRYTLDGLGLDTVAADPVARLRSRCPLPPER
jgi:hypothetical protein